jgi:hypothetical protein
MLNTDPDTEQTLQMDAAINTNCPWSGKPIAPDSLTLYKDRVIGFCNPGCRDAFAKAIADLESELPQKNPSDIAKAIAFFEEILDHPA